MQPRVARRKVARTAAASGGDVEAGSSKSSTRCHKKRRTEDLLSTTWGRGVLVVLFTCVFCLGMHSVYHTVRFARRCACKMWVGFGCSFLTGLITPPCTTIFLTAFSSRALKLRSLTRSTQVDLIATLKAKSMLADEIFKMKQVQLLQQQATTFPVLLKREARQARSRESMKHGETAGTTTTLSPQRRQNIAQEDEEQQ